jgi:hypothetical protein
MSTYYTVKDKFGKRLWTEFGLDNLLIREMIGRY